MELCAALVVSMTLVVTTLCDYDSVVTIDVTRSAALR
jgi:hypothetical protein